MIMHIKQITVSVIIMAAFLIVSLFVASVVSSKGELTKMFGLASVTTSSCASGTLCVDGAETHQTIDGFGVALVSTAWNARALDPVARAYTMDALFSTKNGAGFSITRSELRSDNHDHNFFFWNDTTNNGYVSAPDSQYSSDSIQPCDPSLDISTTDKTYCDSALRSQNSIQSGGWDWNGNKDQDWGMEYVRDHYGVNRMMTTVWSPPPWMKDNDSYTGKPTSAGQPIVRPDKYQAYADYLSRYVREYKDRYGITITDIDMANEPSFDASYQGALWSPTDMVDFLGNYLRPTLHRSSGSIAATQSGTTVTTSAPFFQSTAGESYTDHEKQKVINWSGGGSARIVSVADATHATVAQSQTISPGRTFTLDVPVNVLAPSDAGWGGYNYVDAILASSTVRDFVDVISQHGYALDYTLGGSTYAQARALGKPLWMTEISHLASWSSGSIAEGEGIDNGIGFAKDIHRAMTDADLSAWVWWWGLQVGSVVPQNGAGGCSQTAAGDAISYACIDSRENLPGNIRYPFNSTRYMKRFFTISQFSRFIRPGYVRVSTNTTPISGVSASAFKDPSGDQVVIVLINDTTSDRTIPLSLTGLGSLSNLHAFRTSSWENMRIVDDVAVSGGSAVVSLPAKSVVTLVKNISLPTAPDNGTSYVSDLDWVSASGGLNPTEPQRDLQALHVFDTYYTALSIGGGGPNTVQYSKGLGTMADGATSTIQFNLNGNCSLFTSDVGVSTGSGGDIFNVYGDGVLLASSGARATTDAPYAMNVDVSGVAILDLVVSNPGLTREKVAWGNAQVTCGGSSPTPRLSLTADTSSINSGDTATLTWSSTNTSSCSAPWTSSTSVSGTQAVHPTTTTTYSMDCIGTDVGLSARASKTIAVATVNSTSTNSTSTTAYIVEFYSDGVKIGESAQSSSPYTMSWTPNTAGSHRITAKVTKIATNESVTSGGVTLNVSSPQTTTQTSSGGSSRSSGGGGGSSAPVASAPVSPTAVSIALKAEPGTVAPGGATTLSWVTKNTLWCSSLWSKLTSTTGSQLVRPTIPTTYTITCLSSDMKTLKQLSVTVKTSGSSTVSKISACTTLTKTLSLGSKDTKTSTNVAKLQKYLNSIGYTKFKPTGYFGALTRTAVIDFQKKNKLPPTGIVGKLTIAKISALSCLRK